MFSLSFYNNWFVCLTQLLLTCYSFCVNWQHPSPEEGMLFPEVHFLRRQWVSVAQLPCFGVWDKNRKSWQKFNSSSLCFFFFISICLFRASPVSLQLFVSWLKFLPSICRTKNRSIFGSVSSFDLIWCDQCLSQQTETETTVLCFSFNCLVIQDKNRLEGSGSPSLTEEQISQTDIWNLYQTWRLCLYIQVWQRNCFHLPENICVLLQRLSFLT